MRDKNGSRQRVAALTLILTLSLSGCGGGGSDDSPPPGGGPNPPATFRLGANVTGVRGTGLVLSNSAQDLNVSTDGSFFFPGSLANGAAYAITVRTHPSTPSQTCTVANATGSINSGDALAQVTCATNSYPVQGTVTGLVGSGLRLGNANGPQSVVPLADGDFSLGSVLSGSTYAVSVTAQPTAPSQTCEVENGAGTIGADAVTNIRVRCTTNRFRLRGVVSGLSGTGLILQSASGDGLTIDSNGAFIFPTPIASGTPYSVTIAGLPASPTQTCSIDAATGTVQNTDVTLAVECVVNRYRVRGVLSGLTGSGLALRLNGTQELVLNANGAFAFDSPLSSGSAFNISVRAQPTSTPAQTCTPNTTAGTITNADIEISVTCATSTFAIGGTVTGLVGSGLVLRSQPGGQVAIAADGSFTFPQTLLSGTPYSIDVVFRPDAPVQTCAIEDDTGVVGAANVSVEVKCMTDRFAYFVSKDTDRIEGYTINSSNGTLMPLGSAPSFATGDAPAGVAMDPSGTFLYVTNSGANTVSGYRIDPISGTLSALPGSPYATGTRPINIAIDPSGHFAYVTNYDAASISGFAIDAVSGALASLSGSPYAAAVGSLVLGVNPHAPVLYVMSDNSSSSEIRHYAIQATGELAPAAGSTIAPLLASSMAFDPAGNRIYATGLQYQMYVYDIQPSGSLSTNAYAFRAPGERIALHPTAPFAFVSNHAVTEKSLSVYALDAVTGAPAEVPGSPFQTGNEPNSIVVHPDGKFVFVTDLVFGGVRGYTIDIATGTLTPIPGSPFALGQSFNAAAVR